METKPIVEPAEFFCRLRKPNRGARAAGKTSFWCNCDQDRVALAGKDRRCSVCGADFAKARRLLKSEPASVSIQR